MNTRLRPPLRLQISRQTWAVALGLSRSFSASCTRRRHQVPPVGPLRSEESWVEAGIPGLYSKDGFRIAWTEKQQHLVDELNKRTVGTTEEASTTKDLLINNARQPDKAALFNYASMAHNNNFFFACLSSRAVEMPKILHEHLHTDFSSVETLKAEFLATGQAMFGPGFVWLVKMAPGDSANYNSRFRILSTYIAGSPYPGAHFRRQPVDMNTHTEMDAADILGGHYMPSNYAGSVGPYSQYQRNLAQKPPGGAYVTPILCVNVWEHAWLHDFGPAGKRVYLDAWWDHINWGKVYEYAGIR